MLLQLLLLLRGCGGMKDDAQHVASCGRYSGVGGGIFSATHRLRHERVAADSPLLLLEDKSVPGVLVRVLELDAQHGRAVRNLPCSGLATGSVAPAEV